MQTKFLKSIHFIILGFAEAVAEPVPRPLPATPRPGVPGQGAPPAPVLAEAPCLPILQADLAGLHFWEMGNFRHQ